MRKKHGFEKHTSLEQAKKALTDILNPINRQEEVSLINSNGRVASKKIKSKHDVPHYDRAAMDGWAVKAEDTYGSSRQSPSSFDVSEKKVEKNEAVRVHTGSNIPNKADAVVMIEDAQKTGEKVQIERSVSKGENIDNKGEDIEKGTIIFEDSRRLTPSDISLLKTLNLKTVEVYEKPKVSVIPTGEELVENNPGPGEVIETNGMMVSLYIKNWGGNPIYREPVKDEKDDIRKALERDIKTDLLVTTGGSSVGKRDYIPEIVENLGEVIVHGVSIKPGHPIGIGKVESDNGYTPIIILPGYPVSCAINSFLFVKHSVSKLGHIPSIPDRKIECRLQSKINSDIGKKTFTRVKIDKKDDKYIAIPVRTGGAGILSSLTKADGAVVTPEQIEGYASGDKVKAIYLDEI